VSVAELLDSNNERLQLVQRAQKTVLSSLSRPNLLASYSTQGHQLSSATATSVFWRFEVAFSSVELNNTAFFEPMEAATVVDLLTTQFRLDTRTKFKHNDTPSKWGWFLVPTTGYVESSAYGPVPTREVEWVEIDPIEQRHIGRRVSPQIIDHTPALLQQLAGHGILPQVVEGRIRIML
jgi:hypothetical protein